MKESAIDTVLQKLVGAVVLCLGYSDYLFYDKEEKKYTVYNEKFSHREVYEIVVSEHQIFIELKSKYYVEKEG